MAVDAPTGAGNVVTVTSASSSGAGNPVGKPANTTDNDVLWVAGYFRNSGGTVTTDPGWSQLSPFNTTNETFGMWTKPIPSAAAESATSYTFTSSAGLSRLILICGRLTGANTSTTQDAAGALGPYVGSVSVVVPAVTAVATGALLLTLVINNTTVATTSVFTADPAMTEVGQGTASTGAATSSMQVAKQLLSASGSTGTRTPTISPAAANSGGFSLTITPSGNPLWTYGYGVTIG